MLIVSLGQPVFCQVKTNKYGLFIIDNLKDYNEATFGAPQKKLVLLTDILKPFELDIVYATPNNFTKKVLYKQPAVYLNTEAAKRLSLVQDSLLKLGYNLLIFDAYRPYAVTEKMWKIVPDDRYAANPAFGSGHNRGIAIDLSLFNTNTGKPIAMPTGFDNFSDSAHQDFMKLPHSVIKNRQMLKNIMEYFGFVALATEWWHFSLPNPKSYPIYNLDFEQLASLNNN